MTLAKIRVQKYRIDLLWAWGSDALGGPPWGSSQSEACSEGFLKAHQPETVYAVDFSSLSPRNKEQEGRKPSLSLSSWGWKGTQGVRKPKNPVQWSLCSGLRCLSRRTDAGPNTVNHQEGLQANGVPEHGPGEGMPVCLSV